MKAFVDPDLCIGCTQCAGLCPEVFTMEGTLAVALLGEIPAEAVPQAVDAPTRGAGEPQARLRGYTKRGYIKNFQKILRYPPLCAIL